MWLLSYFTGAVAEEEKKEEPEVQDVEENWNPRQLVIGKEESFIDIGE